MIADTGKHRYSRSGKDGREAGIAFIIPQIGQIPGCKDDIRLDRIFSPARKHCIKTLAIEFVRITRVKTDMNVGDLGDQHQRDPMRQEGVVD